MSLLAVTAGLKSRPSGSDIHEMATKDAVALAVLWRGLLRCLLLARLAFGGVHQRQWPVPQTATAPAPAPTMNQSALRCRRCQNVPPLAVVMAASRSLVTAASFAALSVESCLAAASWAWQERQSWTKSKSGFRSTAGICAEGASGRSCWFAGVAAAGDSSPGEISAEELATDGWSGSTQPFFPAHGGFPSCAVPCWTVPCCVAGTALRVGVTVMG